VATVLRERAAELRALDEALTGAVAGRGAVVLVAGEAGIGKTSLVRAFLRAAGGRARLLVGACDDLLSPRALGPLRDAARQDAGPLAAALAGDDREAVLGAVLDTLTTPTVLVVEDVHWADEATLDVLRHVGRRVPDLPAVLVVTYRDDEVGADHPLRRLLGAFAGGPVRRLTPRPLSEAAVGAMAGADLDAGTVHLLTGGNPFYVTEVLAAGLVDVPGTVADAVLARLHGLDPAAQQALEQLSVVPSGTELALARALLPGLDALADAERRGMLEVAPHAVRFRHELARRAVEGALPASRRMQLNAAVLAALRDQDPPDLARIVHHAVQAADDAAVVAYAPQAAAVAARAGAGSQAAALYEEVLARPGVPDERRAELYQLLARVLFDTNRRHDALAAAASAVALHERLGDPVRLGAALSTLALQQWANFRIDDALASAHRAVALLRAGPGTPQLAAAHVQLAVLLVNLDRDAEALAAAEAGLAVDDALGGTPARARGLVYRGRARAHLGDPSGVDEVRAGLQLALDAGDPEAALFYTNLASVLWRLGRHAELEACVVEADAYLRTRDLTMGDRATLAFGHRLAALRGEWAAAEEGLRWVVAGDDAHGMLGRQALPTLAQLAVRRGDDDAEALLAAARENAERSRNLHALVPTAAALAERGWLTGDPGRGDLARTLLPRLESRGHERERGELARWLHRLGDPVGPSDGCPPEYAAGLRGDWRAAADAWSAIGAPYERALELVDSGEPEPMREALAVLDRLGAAPAAALTRRRLRAAGVLSVPRGPQAATRADPTGLTARQQEVLTLLAAGLTNGEIAARLVLSVRTVDHHVSAVLAKLGVATRREAVAALRR
jgi:DNA-binding CsgD family transcriptional regulator